MTIGRDCEGISALIDTGASVTLIDLALANKLKAKIRKPDKKLLDGVTAIDGGNMNLVGYIKACLVVGDGLYPHRFYVRGTPKRAVTRTKPTFDVILGLDLIREIGVLAVDYKQAEVVLFDSNLGVVYSYDFDVADNRLIVRNHAGQRWNLGNKPIIPDPSGSSREVKATQNRLSGLLGGPNGQAPGEVVRVPVQANARKEARTGGTKGNPVSPAAQAHAKPGAQSADVKHACSERELGVRMAKALMEGQAVKKEVDDPDGPTHRRATLELLAALHAKYVRPTEELVDGKVPLSLPESVGVITETLNALEAAEGDIEEIEADWDSVSESLNYLRTWKPVGG